MPEQHRDFALDEVAPQLLGDLGVEAGQHLLFEFDDRHLRPEGLVEVAELQPIAPAPITMMLDGMRSCTSASLLVITPSPICMPGKSRSPEPAAIMILSASIVEAVSGGFPSTALSAMWCGPAMLALASKQVDVVFFEQEAHAFLQFVGDVARARDDALEIDTDLAGGDAVLLRRAANLFHHLGGVEQCLGWDASPVEAYATGLIALDDGNFHLQLRSRESRRHSRPGRSR